MPFECSRMYFYKFYLSLTHMKLSMMEAQNIFRITTHHPILFPKQFYLSAISFLSSAPM